MTATFSEVAAYIPDLAAVPDLYGFGELGKALSRILFASEKRGREVFEILCVALDDVASYAGSASK